MKPKKIVIKLTPEQVALLNEEHQSLLKPGLVGGMHLGQVYIMGQKEGVIICQVVTAEQAVELQKIGGGKGESRGMPWGSIRALMEKGGGAL
jgi:hypothetical protein